MKKYIKSDRTSIGYNSPKYAIYVFDGDDNKWEIWGGWYRSLDEFDADAFLDSINHPNFPNPEYNYDRNYLDVKVIPNGEDIADYIESSTSIKCSEISDDSSSKLSSGDSKEMSDIIFDTLFGNTQFPQFDPDLCTEIDDETGDTQYVDRGKSEIVFGYMGHVYKIKVSCID